MLTSLEGLSEQTRVSALGSLQATNEQLGPIIQTAADRFRRNLERALPRTAALIHARLKRVPAAPATVEVCLALRSFPAFSMPYWLTPPDRRETDQAFHVDCAYSTMNGYYFVRLLDNVTDGDGPPELRRLLPAAGYFFSEFQAPYQAWFPPEHRFWPIFREAWNEQAEAASIESDLEEISLATFLNVSARKFSAAKGPLAAAALRYGLSDELDRQFAFVDRLGAFSQLHNDLFDWSHDHSMGIRTYVQSEYARRTATSQEPLYRWIVREGFEWGAEQLRTWLSELADVARELDSGDAVDWVTRRAQLLEEELSRARQGLSVLARLAVTAQGN